MPLDGIKVERFSALMNGVFVGVGIIFLIWGATDIAFPITEIMNVAVFGLIRIILGIISLSVGLGVESVQWAKIGKGLDTEKKISSSSPAAPDTRIDQPRVEAATETATNAASNT